MKLDLKSFYHRFLKFKRSFVKNDKVTKILPDDIFLVSYPKSGNTWVRFILANYIANLNNDELISVGFDQVNNLIPEFETNNTAVEILKHRPRIIKSHSSFNAKFPKVIYISRDGKDVAVSYFHYLKKINFLNEAMSFQEFLGKFNTGNIPFGIWSNHVIGWKRNISDRSNVHFVDYEDLLLNTKKSVSEILEFCGLPIMESNLNFSINESSFNALSKRELKEQNTHAHLKNTNHRIPFIRKGESGDYKNYFTDEMIVEFNRIHNLKK